MRGIIRRGFLIKGCTLSLSDADAAADEEEETRDI